METTSPSLTAYVLTDESQSYDHSFKIIIIGDSGVGKTCLALKASKDYFNEYYNATIGFEFATINVKVSTHVIKLQIWDTCGQENYRSLINSFYRNSALAMMVYSIDDMESFHHLNTWLKEIRSQSSPEIKIFLIGCKTDLVESRKVSKAQGEEFAKTFNIDFFMETSAKTGFNAKNVFTEAAKVLYLHQITMKTLESQMTSYNESNFIGSKHLSIMMEKERKEKTKVKCC